MSHDKKGGNCYAKYVDGFILVVPDNKVAEYTRIAEEGRNSWMKHGALSYFECKGEDFLPVPIEGGDVRVTMKSSGPFILDILKY